MRTILGFITFTLLIVFTSWLWRRFALFGRARCLDSSGFLVTWDNQILREEGGTYRDNETEWVARVRHLLFGRPMVIMASIEFMDLDEFQPQRFLEQVLSLGRVRRIVIDRLPFDLPKVKSLIDARICECLYLSDTGVTNAMIEAIDLPVGLVIEVENEPR